VAVTITICASTAPALGATVSTLGNLSTRHVIPRNEVLVIDLFHARKNLASPFGTLPGGLLEPPWPANLYGQSVARS